MGACGGGPDPVEPGFPALRDAAVAPALVALFGVAAPHRHRRGAPLARRDRLAYRAGRAPSAARRSPLGRGSARGHAQRDGARRGVGGARADGARRCCYHRGRLTGGCARAGPVAGRDHGRRVRGRHFLVPGSPRRASWHGHAQGPGRAAQRRGRGRQPGRRLRRGGRTSARFRALARGGRGRGRSGARPPLGAWFGERGTGGRVSRRLPARGASRARGGNPHGRRAGARHNVGARDGPGYLGAGRDDHGRMAGHARVPASADRARGSRGRSGHLRSHRL